MTENDPWARNGVSERSHAAVISNQEESLNNWRLCLEVAADSSWLSARPGQFLMVSPGPLDEVYRADPLLPRPMAIYRVNRHEPYSLEILYKRVGRGTALLTQAIAGDRVSLVGPLGKGFPGCHAGKRPILVGGGTGIASLYELANELAQEHAVEVILGARSKQDLLGLADFEKLPVTLHAVTEDGNFGHQGLVTHVLEQRLEADPQAELYVCGPNAMMRACAAIAESQKIACHVSLENPMACGIGVCLGCAAPLQAGGVALVCRDGPVFDAAKLAWERFA